MPQDRGLAVIFCISTLGLAWYIFIWIVIGVGIFKLYQQYGLSSHAHRSADDLAGQSPTPHVTIIRPVTGQEPMLELCLKSAFEQDYPRTALSIYLCLPSRLDLAYVASRQVCDFAQEKWPQLDIRLYVQERANSMMPASIGPNPKIANVSQAYRDCRSEIVWMLDCNVWVGSQTCRQMVNELFGLCGSRQHTGPAKLVHQMPLAVALDVQTKSSGTGVPRHRALSDAMRALSPSGASLESMFLSTSHAKFYTAINTVAIAPCLVGKSNMFRKLHLNQLIEKETGQDLGLDYFSWYLCEDHLIGDLLWKCRVPLQSRSSTGSEGVWRNHVLLQSCPAIQPLTTMTRGQYISRRARWLTVRKWTVVLATAVEPGTEAFVCSLVGAVGLSFLVVGSAHSLVARLALASALWIISLAVWATTDRWISGFLQNAVLVSGFPHPGNAHTKALPSWLVCWLYREALALPVWIRGVCLSNTVVWRNQRIRVGFDMRARLLQHADPVKTQVPADVRDDKPCPQSIGEKLD